MASGQFTLSGTSPNLYTGAKTIGPITMTGTAALGAITDFTPVAGVNTVTVPSTSVFAVAIVPNGCGLIAVGSSSGGLNAFSPQVSGEFCVINFSSAPPATFALFASSSGGTVELNWI